MLQSTVVSKCFTSALSTNNLVSSANHCKLSQLKGKNLNDYNLHFREKSVFSTILSNCSLRRSEVVETVQHLHRKEIVIRNGR